jgi:8-amino-7-oxononanoate synthase
MTSKPEAEPLKALASEIIDLRTRGLWRELRSPAGVDFSSNDYLGLSQDRRVRDALLDALNGEMPLAATGSRLLRGNTEFHEGMEEFLRATFQSEASLVFNSGYAANVGVLGSIGDEKSVFFSDSLNHASLIDGMRLSGAQRQIFRHNDLNDLEDKLRRHHARTGASACASARAQGRDHTHTHTHTHAHVQVHTDGAIRPAQRKIIVTESVFSMDGDRAPLSDLIALARRYEAWLYVDEAHATGIFGATGLGCLEGIDLVDVPVLAMHTCGKALGGFGAFLICDRLVRDYLVNRARSFVYSTALPPHLLLQARVALTLVREEPTLRQKLLENAKTLRSLVADFIDTGPGDSQIVPVPIGGNDRALVIAQSLRDSGFDVRAIRSPTVPIGTERLRISVKSFHTEREVSALAHALREVMLNV